MATSSVKTLTIGKNTYYAQVYQGENGRYYGKAWDTNGVDILITDEFDKPRQAWDIMYQSLVSSAILRGEP